MDIIYIYTHTYDTISLLVYHHPSTSIPLWSQPWSPSIRSEVQISSTLCQRLMWCTWSWVFSYVALQRWLWLCWFQTPVTWSCRFSWDPLPSWSCWSPFSAYVVQVPSPRCPCRTLLIWMLHQFLAVLHNWKPFHLHQILPRWAPPCPCNPLLDWTYRPLPSIAFAWTWLFWSPTWQDRSFPHQHSTSQEWSCSYSSLACHGWSSSSHSWCWTFCTSNSRCLWKLPLVSTRAFWHQTSSIRTFCHLYVLPFDWVWLFFCQV